MIRQFGNHMTKESRMLLVFLLGLLMGTFFFNFIGTEYLEEMVLYKGIIEVQYKSIDFSPHHLWGYLVWDRGKRFLLLFVLQLTGIGLAAAMCCSFYYGFATGTFLSAFTIQYGLKGIPAFFVWILPHYILYIIMWKCLFSAKWQDAAAGKRLIASFGCFLGGTFLEAYVNTVLLQKILEHI